MCGVYGYIGSRRDLTSPEALIRAIEALKHRGPDDSGTFHDDGPVSCALAHTRLSIIDLSAGGHQPLSTPDGRYTITYNGELYNYLELRRALETEGVAFRSSSDTEVLLAAYARWGRGALERLRGMFAFGIWDARERSLFLARDRFGIKPLYFAASSGGVAFASEVRALLAVGAVPRRLSTAGLATSLVYGAVSSPDTVIEGVECLPPGHTLTFQGGEIRRERYWHLSNAARLPRPRSFAEAAEGLRPILAETMKMHLIADVRVGVFLSGGVDSSVLTALGSAASDRPLHTFTVVFDEAQFSEAEHAAAIARREGCDHAQVMLRPGEAALQIQLAVAALDQPSADGLNTFVVSRAARAAGLAVALSGLGGDELFAGYPTFRAVAHGRALPLAVTSALRALASGDLVPRRLRKAASVLAGERPEDIYPSVRALFTPAELVELAPELHAGDGTRTGGVAGVELARTLLAAGDPVNALSTLELSNYIHDTLLRDSDVMSMAHSLEVRVPLLDHVFAEHVLAVPGAFKLQGSGNKALLMDLAPGVPRAVGTRRKMGFVLPLAVWFRGPLRSWIEGLLFDTAPRRLGSLLRRAAIERHWRTFLEQGDAGSSTRVWSLAQLAAWADENRASL